MRTRLTILGLLLAGLAASAGPDAAGAHGGLLFGQDGRKHREPSRREKSFQRVGTFGNYLNLADRADETLSEIVAATADGRTLVYTDSAGGAVGFIDITDPGDPQPAGFAALDPNPADDVEYQPTSVAVLGNRLALVAANTSQSLTDTSGKLVVIDMATHAIVDEVDLGGQPDSIKISPDERYAAIVIENERDEALCVGGSDHGLEIVDPEDHVPGVNTTEDLCASGGGVPGGLPQTPFGNPAGYLVVLDLVGASPATWVRHDVGLTGYSTYAPEDPEPEFVDVNRRNHAVVTLQEQNHVVIVDLATHSVIGDFGAGRVTLRGVDAVEDGVIRLVDTLPEIPREPDGVAWVPAPWGGFHIATANEGDLFGGSRGFSIFSATGAVRFDAGASVERLAVQHGHYPESRSDAKGTEPEAIVYARFGDDDYLVVGSERGGFLAVYTLDRRGQPEFKQLLPAPLEPEGLLAIPRRNLIVASGEVDTPPFGVRSTVMIYELKNGPPAYPQIMSDDDDRPIGWSAMSGMVAAPGRPHTLLGVWDSYYSTSRIFRIDVSDKPAVVTGALSIRGAAGALDPEGIAIAPDGTMWIASEGNAADNPPNLLIHVDQAGNVIDEFGLPERIVDCRAASTRRGTLGSGFEGVAVLRSRRHGGSYRLLVAQQRGWDYTTADCEDLDDDGGGLNARNEPNRTRIWIYDPAANTWDHVAWELAPKPPNAAWAGLSEITELPGGGAYLVLERDNITGDFAELKTLVRIDWRGATADRLISAGEKAVFDFQPRLEATHGWITDKPEGVAVTSDGDTYIVTDNDGVEDWAGETWFLDLGKYWRLFR